MSDLEDIDFAKVNSSTLRVGMTFATASDGLHAVQDFALAEKKFVRVGERSGAHRAIACTGIDCPMRVRLYRKQVKKAYGPWYLSSMDLEHKNCTAVANPSKRQIISLPTFVSAVTAYGKISAAALLHQVQRRDSISLKGKLRTLYRAKDAASNVSIDAVTASYQKIHSLLHEFAKLNPRPVVAAEQDESGRFKRAIVASGVFRDAEPARQRVMGVDCAHTKCASYTGVQMLLVGRDSDMRNVTLAFALVPAEDLDNYRWFFETLRSGGFDFTGVPIFCDRNPSLLSVAEPFSLELRYCTLHIIRNVIAKFHRFKQQYKNSVWQVQGAETKEEYESRLAWVGTEVDPAVKTYLEEIPAARWCVHANVGIVPLYGWRTSNFVESAFGTQLVNGMRSLYPFAFMETMCSALVDACYLRSQNAAKWPALGLRVTPAAQRMHDHQTANVGQYADQHASEEIAYV